MDFSFTNVSIQQMLVFLQVVDRGGFAKASTVLNMTQSAVSKCIARLEKELEITLFQRTTREIHLTEAGKILYSGWKKQVKAIHDCYLEAVSVQNQEYKVLHIGILNTARPELYFWEIEEKFHAACPEIELELSTEYMTDLEMDLVAGKYDLIMIPDFERFFLEDAGLCWKWAACSYAQVIMSVNHSLAKRKSLNTVDILYENFAALEQTHRQTYREDLEERLARYYVKPHVVLQYRNAYEIKYLFQREKDAILVADAYFDYPENSSLVRIPLKDQINGIICAWNPGNAKPQVKKFLDRLRPLSHQD